VDVEQKRFNNAKTAYLGAYFRDTMYNRTEMCPLAVTSIHRDV
jgi:hypothetical protein